jgi:Flagellar transcriptional activator (FlhC)
MTMRVSDDRYSRDRSRFDIAMQFIRHEARTHTIRLWTGLSDDRIRKLYRFYLRDLQGPALIRHRGKSPQQVSFFMRSGRARQEAAMLASLCRMVGALPQGPAPELVRALPSLGRGEMLCQAYGVYRGLIPQAIITFEHAVFLLTALVRGDELILSGCRDCSAVLIIDRWSLRSARCALCGPQRGPERGPGDASASLAGPLRGLQDWRSDDPGPEFIS